MKLNYNTIAYILLGSIIIVFIIGGFAGWFKKDTGLKLVEGEGEVDRLPNNLPDLTRYRSIAKQVKQLLEGVNYQSGYFEAAAAQLLDLNYNELRLVHNVYIDEFKTKDFPTLRLLIQGEYLDSVTGVDVIPCRQSSKEVIGSNCWKQQKVIDKLNYINA